MTRKLEDEWKDCSHYRNEKCYFAIDHPRLGSDTPNEILQCEEGCDHWALSRG